MDKAGRKALSEQFRQTTPQAGVYRIVNRRTGRLLLGSTTNLAGLRNRFEFGRSSGSAAAIHPSLASDIRSFGLDSFSFEVLDLLEPSRERTPAQVAADLATLEALWREKTDPSLLY